jgi:hypothetical protein
MSELDAYYFYSGLKQKNMNTKTKCNSNQIIKLNKHKNTFFYFSLKKTKINPCFNRFPETKHNIYNNNNNNFV